MVKRRTVTPALSFVILMGIVSLFSDMTHEGARSIYGAFLALAGASAATIGFVSGCGEFIGYSFRLITGYITDKTHSYWLMSMIGYLINMLAIPLIALITPEGWKLACFLIIFERVGKAIRQPAKNTLVSFASSQVGQGKAFALQEFLDQIGAFSGPLLLFVVIWLRQGHGNMFDTYRICFAALLIPALLTLFYLFRAKRKFPHPEQFEIAASSEEKLKKNHRFIIYLIAISFFAFGFIDFPLITMHVSRLSMVPEMLLPLLYSFAMLVDAVAALFFGWLYDKHGIGMLIISNLLSAFFAVFVFLSHSLAGIIFGVLLWGIGMGAQESILKSTVATLVPKKSRSTGFGIFETSFGIFWFLGSWILGILYDHSVVWMTIVSVGAQLLSLPLLAMIVIRKRKV